MRTTRHDLRDRLVRLGDEPAAPSPTFVADLERRLLVGSAPVSAPPSELRDRLTWLGTRPVPGPSPEFVAALEHRLIGTPAAGSTVVALASRRRSRVARAVTGAAAAVAVVLLAGALLGGFRSQQGVSLDKAVNTVVVLPGGHQVTGTVGLNLPNGTVIATGPNGHASVGSVTLGPSSQATVNNGQLQAPTRPGVSVPSAPSLTLPPVSVPSTPTLPNLP
jgi:hypothetical protein